MRTVLYKPEVERGSFTPMASFAMVKINPDRARSRLQNMTNVQLRKLADKHHIKQEEHGRKLTRKRLIAQLMLEDSIIDEFGKSE